VDSVPAEVAKEVCVLLENPDAAACTGEQESGHHSGRPAAGDYDIRITFRRHDANALTAVSFPSQCLARFPDLSCTDIS
jgi:hypothetical protein